MNRWINYLANEHAGKLKRLDVLESGSHDGVTRDITDEQIASLRQDIAEIEVILREEGCSFPGD